VQEPQPEERQEPAAPAAQANQSPAEYFDALRRANPKNRGEPATRWAKERLHPLMMKAFDSGLIIGKRWSPEMARRSLYERK
jgi:hypothetical protein